MSLRLIVATAALLLATGCGSGQRTPPVVRQPPAETPRTEERPEEEKPDGQPTEGPGPEPPDEAPESPPAGEPPAGPPGGPAPTPAPPRPASVPARAIPVLVGNARWGDNTIFPDFPECIWADWEDTARGHFDVLDEQGRPMPDCPIEVGLPIGDEYRATCQVTGQPEYAGFPTGDVIEVGPEVRQLDARTDAGGRVHFAVRGGISTKVAGEPVPGNYVAAPIICRAKDDGRELGRTSINLESMVDEGQMSDVRFNVTYPNGKGPGKEVKIEVDGVTARSDSPRAGQKLAGQLIRLRWPGDGRPNPQAPFAPMNKFSRGDLLPCRPGTNFTDGMGSVIFYWQPAPEDEDIAIRCWASGTPINRVATVSMQ